MTRSLLVLSYFPAVWPARSGGEVRLGHLYRALAARGWSVTLLSATDGDARFEEIEHAPNFREMRVPKDATWDKAATALARSGIGGDLAGLAFAVAASDPDWPLRRLARAAAGKASLVVHESPFSEPLFSGEDGLTEVYAAHNHEASLIGEVAGGGEGAAEAWLRVWRLERRLARRAALVLAPSVEDLDRMRILYGVAPQRLAEAPNGFDPDAASAVAACRCHGDAGGRRPALLFLGSAHPPNVEAARYLARIAPEVPEADLVLAGAAGDALPEPLPDNLRRVGPVDEAGKAGLLGEAAAFLNPVETGSGTSLKALEAVAAGIPLVSTPFGVRGLSLRDGQHGAIRPRGPGFVAGIRAVLADPLRAALVAANAAGAVESLSWPQIAQALDGLLADAAEGRLNPQEPPQRRLVLALNDYPVEGRESGGATRIRETLSRLDADVVLLGFAPRPTVSRIEKNIVGIGLPKSIAHQAFERDLATVWDVPAEDVAAALCVAGNRPLLALAQDLAGEAGAAVFEHCYMAPVADRLPRDLPLVYAAHNLEAAMKRDLAQGNEAGETAAAIVEELERRLVAAARVVVACAEEDAAAFRSLGARTLTVGHGASVAAGLHPEPETSPIVGFLGSAHGPNREAAEFLVREVAPHLPEATVEIVGEVCGVLKGPFPENLRLRGPLAEAEKSEALRGWSLALNPVETGGGANLKLADYLAHGLMVVATPFGARGLPLAQQALGFVAARKDFVRAIEAALSDPQGTQAAGVRALAFATEHLAWDRLVTPYRAEIGALLDRARPAAPAADLVIATDLALDTEDGRRRLLDALDGMRAGRIEVLASLAGPVPALAQVDRIVAVAMPAASAPEALASRIAVVEAGARFLHHPAPLGVAGLDPAEDADGPRWRLGGAFALLLPARARSLRLAGTSGAPLVLHLSSRQLGGGGAVRYPPVALEDAFELVLPLQGGPRPRLLEGRLTDEAGGSIDPDEQPVVAISAAAASAERSAADWQQHLPLALDAEALLRRRAPRLHREASLAASREGGADPALTAAWATAIAGLGRRGRCRALILSAEPHGAAARAARTAFTQAGWPVSDAEPAGRRDDPWSPMQIADQRAGLALERGLVGLTTGQGAVSPRALLAALSRAGLDLDVVVPDGPAARLYRSGQAAAFLPAAPEAWLPACRAIVLGGWDEGTADLLATARAASVPVLIAAGAESEVDPGPGESLEAIVSAISPEPEG